MNYNDGIEKMLHLSNERGTFEPYKNIIINYPGKKSNGDYRLTFKNGQAPTHSEISKKLYDLIMLDNYEFNVLNEFLVDVYRNGTNTTYNDLILEDLKHLLYWITLQEEINYPRKKGFAGIKLPFCRFFEAIYCTKQISTFKLNDVLIRCNNHGRKKPELYSIDDSPCFYSY